MIELIKEAAEILPVSNLSESWFWIKPKRNEFNFLRAFKPVKRSDRPFIVFRSPINQTLSHLMLSLSIKCVLKIEH